jgi:type I restriction enzyme S subunit
MSKKEPEIRFKGFTDDWEQRKLGEVAEITMGQSPSSKNYTQNSKDYILVQGNADLKDNIVVPRVWTTQITKKADRGDIIISVRAPVGDVGMTQYEVVLGRGVAGIKGNLFIYQILKKLKLTKYWRKFSTGSTFESINSKDLNGALLLVPTDNEQNKIGLFLEYLDEVIILHQQQLENLEKSKKAFLQKMFPKKGESVPEIRFNGFSGDWEKRELGEVTKVKTGSSDLQDADPDGKYPFFVRSENIERSNRYIFEGEAILIPGDGRLGDIYHYVNGKFDYHQRVYKISDFENVDSRFVLYYMQRNFKRHAMRYTVKATVDSLRMPMLTEFTIKLPQLSEQEAVGEFFKLHDDLIAHHKKSLEKLKQIKKAFLQKMFV